MSDKDRCAACGKLWTNHPGIIRTCFENIALREALQAERERAIDAALKVIYPTIEWGLDDTREAIRAAIIEGGEQ